jgi:hypothetical protein
VFASRCIDAWWQSGGIQRPMEARLHDLSDGFAIPGPRSQSRLPAGAVSSTSAQLRNDAGTTYIEIDALGKIKLVSGVSIDITGDVNVTGTLTASVDVVGGGKHLATHTHSVSVPSTPFSGNTGAPS